MDIYSQFAKDCIKKAIENKLGRTIIDMQPCIEFLQEGWDLTAGQTQFTEAYFGYFEIKNYNSSNDPRTCAYLALDEIPQNTYYYEAVHVYEINSLIDNYPQTLPILANAGLALAEMYFIGWKITLA
jgi:hypothetical protein